MACHNCFSFEHRSLSRLILPELMGQIMSGQVLLARQTATPTFMEF